MDAGESQPAVRRQRAVRRLQRVAEANALHAGRGAIAVRAVRSRPHGQPESDDQGDRAFPDVGRTYLLLCEASASDHLGIRVPVVLRRCRQRGSRPAAGQHPDLRGLCREPCASCGRGARQDRGKSRGGAGRRDQAGPGGDRGRAGGVLGEPRRRRAPVARADVRASPDARFSHGPGGGGRRAQATGDGRREGADGHQRRAGRGRADDARCQRAHPARAVRGSSPGPRR